MITQTRFNYSLNKLYQWQYIHLSVVNNLNTDKDNDYNVNNEESIQIILYIIICISY